MCVLAFSFFFSYFPILIRVQMSLHKTNERSRLGYMLFCNIESKISTFLLLNNHLLNTLMIYDDFLLLL